MLRTEPVVARSAVQGNRSPTSATITFPPPLTDRAARLSLPNSIFYAVLVSNSKNMRIKCYTYFLAIDKMPFIAWNLEQLLFA